MDLVSIIIPNYNRENLVMETVQNMLDQDYPEKEIIVVDDGSTDNSIARLNTFKDSITLVTQKNQGPGAARNHGLEIAKGRFIQFMDNDDLASMNKISSQVKSLQKNRADAVYCPWGKFDIHTPSIRLEDCILQSKAIPPSLILPALLEGWSTVLQIFMFRKDFLEGIGPFKTDVSYLEDIDYFVRVILNNAVIAFEDAPIVIYRNNSEAKLSATGADPIKKNIAEAEFFNSFISHLKIHVPTQFKPLEKRLASLTAETFYNLKDSPEIFDSLPHLKSLLPQIPSERKLKAAKKLTQWKIGLKQRVYGSRYHKFFYPQPLNEHHKQLIHELGYSEVVSNKI